MDVDPPAVSPSMMDENEDVDDRTAIHLLALARQLLRRRHGAIAGMIDYAIAEIEDPARGSD